MAGSWHHPPRPATQYTPDEPDIQVRQAGVGFSVVRRWRVEPQHEKGRAIPCELTVCRGLSFDEACRRAELMDRWLREPRGMPPPEWPDEKRN